MALFLLTVATFAAFQLLVLVYVLAQALVGRAVGARVEMVCVGFGPTLVRGQFGSVEYGYALIPTGGYTRFWSGEEEPWNDSAEEVPFNKLPPAARMLVAVSGPVASIVFGLLLLAGAMFLSRSEVAVGAAVPVRPTGVPALGVTRAPATFESQKVLFRDTFLEFFRRLVTFQSLRGWGGWAGSLVTTAAAGKESAGAWLSCFGVLCLGNGLLNLLPMPPLSGGTLVLLGIEKVRGPLPDGVSASIVWCGILLILAAFATMACLDVVWAFNALMSR